MKKYFTEKWGIFEITLQGPTDGNPFVDVKLQAIFKHNHREIIVDGFYDGEGIYKIRFMPDSEGRWEYITLSNRPELDNKRGEFECVKPSTGNHGPVRIKNKYHFCYEDGTPYHPFGTTCYAWIHQPEYLQEKTLETLKKSPFNKIRMCVFPKHYPFNNNEPLYYPFEGSVEKGWDFSRFNPQFFRHLEKRVKDLMDLGIEADIILFHPYDRWGFANMGRENDERYLRYIVARLSAFRNVWWSLANEYDAVESKNITDWDRYFKVVQESDPYQHLRSIHNMVNFYDHSKPWVTHLSVQTHYLGDIGKWREQYKKPVLIDECGYEGNIEYGWGNLTAEELVRRFWEGVVRGGYVTHGETYLHPEDILWWSKGGELYGDSPERIRFLKKIVEEAPVNEINPTSFNSWDVICGGKEGEYYLMYFGNARPAERTINLPKGKKFKIDIIDTWKMTITPLDGLFEGDVKIKLPGIPYIAIRIIKVE